MFILSSISRDLEFWSVNHISLYKNYELNVFKNRWKILDEIFNNWRSDLLETRLLLMIVVNKITKF